MKGACTTQLNSTKPGVSPSTGANGVTLATSATRTPQGASAKKCPTVTSKARETSSGGRTRTHRPTALRGTPSACTQNGIAATRPKTSGATASKTSLSAAASGSKAGGGTYRTRTTRTVSGPKSDDQTASPPRKRGSRGVSKTPVNSHRPKTNGINGTPIGPIKVRSAKNTPKAAAVSSSIVSHEPAAGGAPLSTTATPSAKRRSRRRRRRTTKKNGPVDEQAAYIGTPGSADGGEVWAGAGAGTETTATTRSQRPVVVVSDPQMADLCRQLREACVVTTPQRPAVVSDSRLADVCRQLREVEQHPEMIEGLWVVGPEDCGEIQVGMETSVVFTIINDSEVDRELQSYGPVVPNPCIVATSLCPCLLSAGSDSTKVIVSMKGSSSQILHNYIYFNFDEGTTLYRRVYLIVASTIVESLVPDGVYVPRRQHPVDYSVRLGNAVEGVKPPCPPPPITPHTKQKSSWVPYQLRAGPERFCLPYLQQPLTLETYSTRFDVLLWLEELGKEKDVRKYDMSSVSLVAEDAYLCLVVPGLAKRKQPVIVGDKLIFSTYKPEEPAEASDNPVLERKARKKKPLPFTRDGEHYSAYVHQICLREEVLKMQFKEWFHESEELCGKKYEVMFTVNRVTLLRMHDALDVAEDIGNQVLFPATKPPPLPPSLECASQNLKFIDTRLNSQQRRAVEAIISGAYRPFPYILFGPPGTGKTVTVVESILQVYKRDTSCKILACAPSNSAADLLAERLHNSGHVNERTMVRLNAAMRSKELLKSIQKYHMATNGVGVKDVVRHSRIVVCTCSTAAVLDQQMVFAYVFVDEAGQALEPECLIPVSFLDVECGQLVLAGDPLQLGPVVFSSLASDNGLSISMLERLMGREPYKRDTTAFAATGNYDSMVVTKLVENYRSHGRLLKLYSDQFYDGELVERADRRMTHSLCNWEHLPTKDIPLLFHGVQGAEKRDRGSPSWFNAFEAEQVLDYAKKLVIQRSVRQSDVGIIAPYNKQVEKIRLLLDGEGLSDVKVGSVEEFQGRENLVIIISTVRSTSTFLLEDIQKQLGFVSSPKRFNVAISRAQALLIVVGNPHLLAQDPCWSKLIQYARDNHCYTGCPLL